MEGGITDDIKLEKPQIIGFAGALLLAIGCFVPIVHLPIVGSINYVFNGRGDGMIVLAMSVVSAVLAFFRIYQFLWASAGLVAVICLYTFFKLESLISDLHGKLDTDLAGNPFRGLADVLVSSVGLEWGWIVLALGIGTLIFAAIAGGKGALHRGA